MVHIYTMKIAFDSAAGQRKKLQTPQDTQQSAQITKSSVKV
jgi:hypothetical protein